MCFKAQEDGLKALNWLQQKGLEWCFARVEPNRFGDQKCGHSLSLSLKRRPWRNHHPAHQEGVSSRGPGAGNPEFEGRGRNLTGSSVFTKTI